jgi:predicted enzyme involved in methoxymalonyl-ACP biosynthesis
MRIQTDARNAVAIGLSDRLSDSGVIAVLVGSLSDHKLILDEVAVSCRALGRQLEDALIARAVRLMAEGRPVETIVFNIAVGPRNSVARQWLQKFAGISLDESIGQMSIPLGSFSSKRASLDMAESVVFPEEGT